ncbi:MAG: hypothetical protein WC310_00070 [Patescibacteria group bacterium]|jgi:hypothetical protein
MKKISNSKNPTVKKLHVLLDDLVDHFEDLKDKYDGIDPQTKKKIAGAIAGAAVFLAGASIAKKALGKKKK